MRLSLRNPLLTPGQIAASPSQRRGLPAELESDMRAYGCHLVQAAGTVLRLPQPVMASAQVLLQRFYYVAALQDFPLLATVLGALFLACKVEESPQTIRNIINVLDIVVKRDRGLPEIVTDGYDTEYYGMKNDMVIAELQILRRLGFNVQVELPYGLLVNYLRSLELTDQQRVPQLAWNYLNDLLRTPVYLCFQPETIACGAIYLAAHECRVCLPTSPPWWSLFDANGEDVVMVAKATRAFYLRALPRVMPLTDDELQMQLAGTLDRHIEAARIAMHSKARGDDDEAGGEAAGKRDSRPATGHGSVDEVLKRASPAPKRGSAGARSPSPDRSRRSRRLPAAGSG
ncbi:hypothetical protein LPJ61_005118 [Coemansia biformis]|uniref:Cyclin-like domain-containing protein n=1 Tax=Coemansia biformis TaxID=1286918 RepID=A0A9W8CWL1_9FUNG|nr:hypothetical protein LPJ61_005118 [Coemansia biformis]